MFSKIIVTLTLFCAIRCAPVQKSDNCLNDERFIETNDPSWVGHCGVRNVISDEFNNHHRARHYRSLAHIVKGIYNHTLDYGSGDLEEYQKWSSQFAFLPTIEVSHKEKDFHQHIQIFAASFQFLQKVQYRYHIQTFPQLFGALEHQALRILCALENNEDITWVQNHISKEEMNRKMCQFNLGSFDKENQNFRNARFTQMLFRRYLHELHNKIIAKVNLFDEA